MCPRCGFFLVIHSSLVKAMDTFAPTLLNLARVWTCRRKKPLTLVTRSLPEMFSGPRSGLPPLAGMRMPTKDGGEHDTMNDDEFSQYALSTMKNIMGDTDITQWQWLIEFEESVPYTNLHLGLDMRKAHPLPFFFLRNKQQHRPMWGAVAVSYPPYRR